MRSAFRKRRARAVLRCRSSSTRRSIRICSSRPCGPRRGVVFAEGLIYAESGAPLAEEAAARDALRIVRAQRGRARALPSASAGHNPRGTAGPAGRENNNGGIAVFPGRSTRSRAGTRTSCGARRAVSKLVVGVADSRAKKPFFNLDERIAIAREVLSHYPERRGRRVPWPAEGLRARPERPA